MMSQYDDIVGKTVQCCGVKKYSNQYNNEFSTVLHNI